MSKKYKGKNSDSPYGINLNGSQNSIALEAESKTIMYERLLKEKDERIKLLEDEISMLKSMLSIKQRWFPE
jgi:hypothetical protein